MARTGAGAWRLHAPFRGTSQRFRLELFLEPPRDEPPDARRDEPDVRRDDPPDRRREAPVLRRDEPPAPVRDERADFRREPGRFRVPPDDFRDGTFAPFSRASLSPMAIACLRLLTVRPEPLFNVPRLRRRIVDATLFEAACPYFAMFGFLHGEERAKDVLSHRASTSVERSTARVHHPRTERVLGNAMTRRGNELRA